MKLFVKQLLQPASKLLIVVSLVLLNTGCSDNNSHQDLKKYTQTIKQRAAKPIKPIPVIAPPERHAYPKTAMRNPFKPLATEAQTSGPDKNRPKEPLEEFPLDSLRMVGLLQRDKTTWAVIQGPSGEVFRATVGNYLGQNYGRIVSIDKNEIKLQEMIKIERKWEKRPAALALINDGDE